MAAERSRRLPSAVAVLLVSLALLNFGLKYLTSILLANTLGVDHYELYAVPVASVAFFSTLVELGLGKQGIRLIPQYIEAEQLRLAAGYWRFAMRVVLALALLVGLLVTLLPGLNAFASDEAMFLLPIVALSGAGAELVLACGAAILATVVVRVVVPGVLLGYVLWASQLAAPGVLTPSTAVLAYGAGWLSALVVLVVAFTIIAPRPVLHGPSEYTVGPWLRGGLGFLGVAIAISALIDGTVALVEFASLDPADISIYAVCIETGGFVFILVKSLDKFYLQRISALLSRKELGEIHRIRRRRALLMLAICVSFCATIIALGRPLLASFGAGFERGYFALCCVAIATSAWTLTSLSQWLIAFIEGPARALRITMGGVFAAYTGILVLGPSQGLMGVALAYAVMVTVMSVLLEIRARSVLETLAQHSA